ncbi:MAG: hypothetical protein IJT87_06575 [Ruminiclostridium sp.]|nr:hypothetical protein [Ruminiclostridium sp.]
MEDNKDYREISIQEAVSDLTNLLSEKGLDYTVHTQNDEGYDYLDDEECRSINMVNKSGDELFIDLQGEFTIFFQEWHEHYYTEKWDYDKLKNDLLDLLSNKLFVFTVMCNNEWMCSVLVRDSQISKEEVKQKVRKYLNHPEFRNKLKINGADICFKFWDDKLNKKIIFKPGEIK